MILSKNTKLVSQGFRIELAIHTRDLLQQAGQTTRRATRSEIKILSTVDVAQLQKDTDRMAQRLRLLDNKLQQTNWSTELS